MCKVIQPGVREVCPFNHVLAQFTRMLSALMSATTLSLVMIPVEVAQYLCTCFSLVMRRVLKPQCSTDVWCAVEGADSLQPRLGGRHAGVPANLRRCGRFWLLLPESHLSVPDA